MNNLCKLFGHTAANEDSYSSFTNEERVRFIKMRRALRKQNEKSFKKALQLVDRDL